MLKFIIFIVELCFFVLLTASKIGITEFAYVKKLFRVHEFVYLTVILKHGKQHVLYLLYCIVYTVL